MSNSTTMYLEIRNEEGELLDTWKATGPESVARCAKALLRMEGDGAYIVIRLRPPEELEAETEGE